MPCTGTTPLKGKMVFLDTKLPANKLKTQLEFLGAQVETFFSKDIWCVITDKQVNNDANKSLFSASSVKAKASPFLNRTQTLLQAAQRAKTEAKVKDDKAQTVLQECRQWDIPLLSVKTASASVSKLMRKFKSPPSNSSLRKNTPPSVTPLRKVVSDSMIGRGEKIAGDIVLKLEDNRQLYRPIHKSFAEQEWPTLTVQPPSTSSPLLSPFYPAEDLVPNTENRKSTREQGHAEAKSRKSHDRKRKATSTARTAEQKQKFCELCQEYFPSLRSHLTSSQHLKAYSGVAASLEGIIDEFQTDFGKESPSKRQRVQAD